MLFVRWYHAGQALLRCCGAFAEATRLQTLERLGSQQVLDAQDSSAIFNYSQALE